MIRLVQYVPELAVIMGVAVLHFMMFLAAVLVGFKMGRKTIKPGEVMPVVSRVEVPEDKKRFLWVEDPWAEALQPAKNPDQRKNRIMTMDGGEEDG